MPDLGKYRRKSMRSRRRRVCWLLPFCLSNSTGTFSRPPLIQPFSYFCFLPLCFVSMMLFFSIFSCLLTLLSKDFPASFKFAVVKFHLANPTIHFVFPEAHLYAKWVQLYRKWELRHWGMWKVSSTWLSSMISPTVQMQSKLVIGVCHGEGERSLSGMSSPSLILGWTWRKTACSADVWKPPTSISQGLTMKGPGFSFTCTSEMPHRYSSMATDCW